MYSKRQENRVKVSLKKNECNEQKLLEDKFISYEPNLINNNNNENNSRNNNLHQSKINKNESKEEEDDYNYSVYNISISKDKNFLNNIISSDEMSKSLGFNENLFFSERKNFGTNSVKFNENIFSSLKIEEKNANENINNLLGNIQLFIRMNKKRKNNYIIDVPYNNYFFNSIDNGSTNISHRIVSRFSKEYKKKERPNESSTIPVIHTRVSSQPFNDAFQIKKKVIKNENYTINLNDDNMNNQIYNRKNSFLLYYTNNENNKMKKMNRVLNNSNILYEENKMNGNSLINLNFLNTDKKVYSYTNEDTTKKTARLEEQYAFDSSGNQKFLCVKRFGDENNRINGNIDNLIIANKTKQINKKNMKINNNLKEIVIKNINMNYPNKIFKKIKSRKSHNPNIIERFVFYSPQISYKNVFSPNSKNCLGKLYKKVSGEINGINGNQHYTSLIKDKVNKSSIKININNNLKNSKSCIFKYWQDKINNKNIKNNLNNSNSYNLKFMNSFNKVINSENGINKNNISNIDFNGNNHTLNNNSRNYSNINNNIENSHRNLYSFNSLQKNIDYNRENNNLYSSARNNKEFLYKSNNENNKIYFPFAKLDNVKVDYSNKNNYKYIEIKLSKEKSNQKIISNNKNISKSMINKNKIINLTSMDNTKIHKKYNNLIQIKKDATKDKKEKNKYK